MKKLISLAFAFLMVMSLVACGGNYDTTNDSTPTKTDAESIEPVESVVESEESVDAIQTESKENDNDSAEWKEFLKDYEKWVDDYIAIVKKQKENPTDMTILADYTEMLTELTEWSEKANDIQESIVDTEDALEYSKEVLRIAGKLADVS